MVFSAMVWMNVRWVLLGGAILLLSVSCSQSEQLKPFTSDGCTLFPNRDLISSQDWCDCCLQHDIAYWKGGTEQQRLAADVALRDCVLAKTENNALANLMYEGVRFGGSPYFYNWYRWGYGWSYQRKYQALTDKEESRANALLNQYWRSESAGVCPAP